MQQQRRQQHSVAGLPGSIKDLYLIRKMANFTFYFASCMLLLTLSWRTSTGLPVRNLSPENHAQCSVLLKSLLLNVTELRNSDVLCYGIRSDEVAAGSDADTVVTCAPTQTENSSCTMQRNSSFSESECLRNIMKDLTHYEAAIRTYLKATIRSQDEVTLLSPTLEILQSLRKNCSPKPNAEADSSEGDAAKLWGGSSFNNRHEMCKMMRGFYTRTITINRAMGYISSGDHRK